MLFLVGLRFAAVALFAVVAGSGGAPAQPAAPASQLGDIYRLVNQGSLSQAETQARAYTGQHPASAEAAYLLAYILFREDKPLPSLKEYTRAAALQKPTAQQLQYVALDYVLAGDYVDADKWMTTATQWSPGDGEAWYSLGRIKYTENRFAESISCFERALTLMPRSVKAENNLGLAYEGLNRDSDALAAYRQAIAWVPANGQATHEDAQPYINLGTLLLQQNQLADAAGALRKAQTLDPGDLHLHVTLGKLYQRTGDDAAAQKQFEQAVALSPDTASYHFLLGQAYRRTGQADKARAEFARAAQLDGAHSSQ